MAFAVLLAIVLAIASCISVFTSKSQSEQGSAAESQAPASTNITDAKKESNHSNIGESFEDYIYSEEHDQGIPLQTVKWIAYVQKAPANYEVMGHGNTKKGQTATYLFRFFSPSPESQYGMFLQMPDTKVMASLGVGDKVLIIGTLRLPAPEMGMNTFHGTRDSIRAVKPRQTYVEVTELKLLSAAQSAETEPPIKLPFVSNAKE